MYTFTPTYVVHDAAPVVGKTGKKRPVSAMKRAACESPSDRSAKKLMLTEFCASGESKACDKRNWKPGTAFLRLTEKLDMRVRKNLDYAIQEARKNC